MSDLLIYKNNTKSRESYFYIIGTFVHDNSKRMIQMKSENVGTAFILIEDVVTLFINPSQELINAWADQQFSS